MVFKNNKSFHSHFKTFRIAARQCVCVLSLPLTNTSTAVEFLGIGERALACHCVRARSLWGCSLKSANLHWYWCVALCRHALLDLLSLSLSLFTLAPVYIQVALFALFCFDFQRALCPPLFILPAANCLLDAVAAAAAGSE